MIRKIRARVRDMIERALNGWAWGSCRYEKWEEAIVTAEKILRMNPSSERGHYLLGYCYSKMGKIDKAIEEYKTVLKINPHNEKARINLRNITAYRDKLKSSIDSCFPETS